MWCINVMYKDLLNCHIAAHKGVLSNVCLFVQRTVECRQR